MKKEVIKITILCVLLLGVNLVGGTSASAADIPEGLTIQSIFENTGITEIFPIRIPDPCADIPTVEIPEPGRLEVERVCRRPNLEAVPLPTGGPSRWCDVHLGPARDEELVVTVKNSGTADAEEPFGVRVTYYIDPLMIFMPPGSRITLGYDPIAAGDSMSKGFPFLPDCISRRCGVTITVDIDDDIRETFSGEFDNMVVGMCP